MPTTPSELPPHVLQLFKTDDTGLKWDDVWNDHDQAAFVIANIFELDILQNQHDKMVRAVKRGLSPKAFVARYKAHLEKRGWWGRKEMPDPISGEPKRIRMGSVARLDIIHGVFLRISMAAEQWSRIDQTISTHPYLLYQMGPSRVHRPEHVAWNGLLVPASDPWWQTHFPPNCFGCRGWVRQVSREEAEEKRWTVSRHPPVAYHTVNDPRTGRAIRVPAGIDPGWDVSHR